MSIYSLNICTSQELALPTLLGLSYCGLGHLTLIKGPGVRAGGNYVFSLARTLPGSGALSYDQTK